MSDDLTAIAFDGAALPMYLVAPDGHFLRANRALCELLGYAESELRTMTFISVTDAPMLEAVLDHYARALGSEAATGVVAQRFRLRDGRVVNADVATTLVRHPDGRPRMFINVVAIGETQRQLPAQRVDGITSEGDAAAAPPATLMGARFTIAQAARRTGLSAHTLRAWERRYGIPAPSRSVSRHRLYDDTDLALIQRMQEAVRAGARHVEAARRVRAETGVSVDEPSGDRLTSDLVSALLARDRDAAHGVLSRALALRGVSAMLNLLLRPALRELDGLEPEAERVDVLEFAGTAARDWLDEVRGWVDSGTGARVVIVASPQEADTAASALGLRMAVGGWSPVVIDGDRVDELTAAVADCNPEVVAVSIAHASGVASALLVVHALRDRLGATVPIILAGRGARDIAELPPGVEREEALGPLLTAPRGEDVSDGRGSPAPAR